MTMRSFRAKPVGWRGESYRHYLAQKGVSSKVKVWDRIKIGAEAETKTQGTVAMQGDFNKDGKNFKEMMPGGKPTLHVFEKKTKFAGKFNDLFPEGENHLVIRNRRGNIVRELWKEKDGIRIDAKSGNPDDELIVSANDDLLYESWMDDFGSVLFVPKNPPVGFPKEKPLKLATEDDDIEYLARKKSRLRG